MYSVNIGFFITISVYCSVFKKRVFIFYIANVLLQLLADVDTEYSPITKFCHNIIYVRVKPWSYYNLL